MTIFWTIIIIAVIVWHLNNANRDKQELPTVTAKNITEDSVLIAQDNFENRIKENSRPDSISGKEIYIYQNLMRVWYAKLASENRYNETMIQKLRSDWLTYMWELENASSSNYLSLETGEEEESDEHRKDHILAKKKVLAIQDAFATAVGKDAVDELAHINAISSFQFNNTGELAPEGYGWDLEMKIYKTR